MTDKLFLIFLFCLLSSSSFGISPLKEYKYKPSAIKIKYDEYKVGTADGHCINAWHMPGQKENKKNICVLIVGSDAGNMGFSLPYVKALIANGYDVITFDYRGFGESSSFKHNPDFLFHTEYVEDFISILNWSKREFQFKKIACFGFSMGTLICNLGKEFEDFDYLIGEGFISSPELLVKRIKKEKNREIKLPLYASVPVVNSYQIPVLMFASTQDKITLIDDVKDFAASTSNRKIIAYDGGHLAGARTIGIKEYMGLILEFLRTN